MPDQHPFRPSPSDPVVIGFAGRMGSGKTSAATHLSSRYGFQYTRYSEVLQHWRSASIDRSRLQELGWDVMAGGLQDELNARLIAGLDCSRSAAIDGLRHLIDFKTLASTFGASFALIFLEASEERRFARLRHRFESFASFQAGDSHPVEGYIDNLRPLATFAISNDGSPEELFQQLDAWLAGFGVR